MFKAPDDLASGEGCLPGLQTDVFLLYLHMSSPLVHKHAHTSVHTHSKAPDVLLKKKLIPSDQGPTLMTSLNLNFSLKTPSSNKP